MARKVETIVTLTDDIDGGKADRTVVFGLGGTNYEIDLSRKNAAAFEKVLAPYVTSARKVRGPRGRATTRSVPDRPRADGRQAGIREWAKANGVVISDRGRFARSVAEAYDAAH